MMACFRFCCKCAQWFSFVLESCAVKCQKFDQMDVSSHFFPACWILPHLVNHYLFTKVSEARIMDSHANFMPSSLKKLASLGNHDLSNS